MSKTYHKFLSFKDNQRGFAKFDKRNANKQVRKFKKYLPNGNKYKHLFQTYDIHDFIFTFYSKREILEWIGFGHTLRKGYSKKFLHAKCLYIEKTFTRESIRFSLDIKNEEQNT